MRNKDTEDKGDKKDKGDKDILADKADKDRATMVDKGKVIMVDKDRATMVVLMEVSTKDRAVLMEV
jgi:hypothetical protein